MVTPVAKPETDPDLLKSFEGLATSTIGNVLDDLGLGGIMLNLRPVGSGMHFIGSALTVKELSGTQHSFRADEFGLGAVVDAVRPGDVVIIDNGGRQVSTWGGVASLAAQRNGAAGLVVDGGVRDADEILELAFATFSRHVVPLSGKTRVKVVEINGEVTVDNVIVQAGDVVIGDATGIVRVPLARAAEIAAKARALDEQDRQAAERVRGGMSFTEALSRFPKL